MWKNHHERPIFEMFLQVELLPLPTFFFVILVILLVSGQIWFKVILLKQTKKQEKETSYTDLLTCTCVSTFPSAK